MFIIIIFAPPMQDGWRMFEKAEITLEWVRALVTSSLSECHFRQLLASSPQKYNIYLFIYLFIHVLACILSEIRSEQHIQHCTTGI